MKRTLKWALCIAMIAIVAMSMVIMGSAAYSELDGVYVSVGQDESVNIEFKPETSGLYSFYSTGDCDTYITLYDAGENYIKSNDDGKNDYNFNLVYELEAGETYNLEVGLYSSSETGEFYVYSEFIQCESLENNQIKMHVNDGDETFVKFVPEVDGIYQLYNQDFNAVGSNYWLIFVTLYDSEFNELYSSSINNGFDLTRNLCAGETYYLRIGAVDFGESNLDQFDIQFYCSLFIRARLCPMLSFEDGVVEVNIRGLAHSSTGHPYIEFVPEKSGFYKFYSSKSGVFPYAELYDDQFNSIYDCEITQNGQVFTIEGYLEEGCTYYIHATLKSDIGGVQSYKVYFEICEIVKLEGNSITITDSSVYIEFVPETEDITGIFRLYSQGDFDICAELYDSWFEEIETDDDHGEDYNFKIETILSSGGTYYLKVKCLDESAENLNYTVTVEEVFNPISEEAYMNVTSDNYMEIFSFIPEEDGLYKFSAIADDNVYAGFTVCNMLGQYIAVSSDLFCNQTMYGLELYKDTKYYICVYDLKYGEFVVDGEECGISISVTNDIDGWLITSVEYSWESWVFFENGEMLKNTWAISPEGWVYLGEDGYALVREWKQDSIGWVYLGTRGVMVTNDIIVDISADFENINIYYVDDDGYMVTNRWINFTEEDGYDESFWVYFGANGTLVVDAWIQDSHGWCYVDENGVMLTEEWVMDSVGWCYVGSDGYCVTNSWRIDRVGLCYLDENGRLLTNSWALSVHGWCYLGSDGHMLKNCWKQDANGWCYLDYNGILVTNKWIQDSQGWCYVGADGYCLTSCWQQDSCGWCYLDENGRMVTNTWVMDSVGWCYVGADGYAVTNCWKQDSHGWCYLDENGSMIKSDWVLDGNTWYYLDGNGYMVTGTYTIGYITYIFAENGAWIG